MDWQAIIDLDKELLLWFNGSQSLYLDSLVRTLTNGWTWLPLYLSLCFVVIKNNDTVQKILFVIACAGLCILIAGAVDDEIVKPTVARWRPTHDSQIGMLVDIVDGYRGGRYGFFSAHASNTFSLTIFFWWLIRSRLLTTAMVRQVSRQIVLCRQSGGTDGDHPGADQAEQAPTGAENRAGIDIAGRQSRD